MISEIKQVLKVHTEFLLEVVLYLPSKVLSRQIESVDLRFQSRLSLLAGVRDRVDKLDWH